MSEFKAMNNDCMRYVYGDQHAGRERKKGWNYPVINRAYADMLQEVAILSSNNPGIEAVPMEDSDAETVKTCGLVFKAIWWEELNMRIKSIQGLTDDHLQGIKVAKWYWEPQASWDEDLAQQPRPCPECLGQKETEKGTNCPHCGGAGMIADGWKGKIECVVINPDYFGCDPDVELAAEIPTKARWVFTERWVDKRWAALRWPKYQQYLRDKGLWDEIKDSVVSVPAGGGQVTTDETGFNRSTFEWRGREASAAGGDEAQLQARLADVIIGNTRDGKSIGRSQSKDLVRVQEFYLRDHARAQVEAGMEDIPMGEEGADHIFQNQGDPFVYDRTKPIYGADAGQITDYERFQGSWPQRVRRPAYERPKYPKGRLVLRLDEDLIVEDQAWNYQSWPFAIGVGYLLPHLWNGVNCVELSRGFQDWMNIVASHLLMYVKYFGDPQWEVEEGALAKDKEKKKLTIPNWAGAIVRFAKGGLGRARRTPPPPLPATLFEIFGLLKDADQDLKGLHDVATGKASGGNTLGELQMLNRNTRQRIALQGAMHDVWLKQIARGVVELMQTHFEVGDWVRYAGDTQETRAAAVQWTSKMADVKFDIVMEPVSTLPYDKERKAMQFIEAYKLAPETSRAAMFEDLLKVLEIPNIKALINKDAMLGPLAQLTQMAMQSGLGPDQLLQALQMFMQQWQAALQGQGAMEPGSAGPGGQPYPPAAGAPGPGPQPVPPMMGSTLGATGRMGPTMPGTPMTMGPG